VVAAGISASTIASSHPIVEFATTVTTFAENPILVPETMLIVLELIVEIPSQDKLDVDKTIDRKLLVLDPLTVEDNAI
jgi:hypothetical protein